MSKLQVGDKFVVLKAKIPGKERFIGTIFTVASINPNAPFTHEPHYGVGEQHNCAFVWFEGEIEPVNEPIPAEPITVNVNVTVNINYDNACWYCRKGGLVDLYFDGKPGICPKCRRVCNSKVETTIPQATNNSVKKANEPLTTDELTALPNGTRVFTVWYKDGEKKWDDRRTRWRIKNKYNELRWENDEGWIDIDSNGLHYYAYLEEPERPIPEPELPF